MEKAITGEIERIDLNLGVLPGQDKPNVVVGHYCLDLEFAVARDDDGERLRRRDHSSDRMHHELLNDPVTEGPANSVSICEE